MVVEETIAAVNNTIFARLFNMSNEVLITVVISAFIIGIFCLTIYFYLGNRKKDNEWKSLGNLEKITFAMLVGIMCLLVSLIYVAILEGIAGIIMRDTSSLPKITSTLMIFFPFAFFFLAATTKKRKDDLTFITDFLRFSLKAIYIGFPIFFFVVMGVFIKILITMG